MPIFRKSYTEHSRVIFAIKAKTQEDADAAYNDYFKNPKKYEELKHAISGNLESATSNLRTFETEEDYNYSTVDTHDIFVDASVKKEPLYDLYFSFEEDPLHKIHKVWKDVLLADVLNKMSEYNKEYIFRNAVPNYKCIADARSRGVIILNYILERRKFNGRTDDDNQER